MAPEMWVGLAFLAAVIVGSLTRTAPLVLGCLVPILFAGVCFIYVEFILRMDSSVPQAVLSALIWSGFGSLAGSIVGHWLGLGIGPTKPPEQVDFRNWKAPKD